jgi:hypothetical protein
VAELLVICAQPFPNVLKSSVNSLPLLMEGKVAPLAYKTDNMKSPALVVVTAGPGVLLRTTRPLEMLVAFGDELETPNTSQAVICTRVGEPTNVGVTTVAPGFEFTAYQISVDPALIVALAPAEM